MRTSLVLLSNTILIESQFCHISLSRDGNYSRSGGTVFVPVRDLVRIGLCVGVAEFSVELVHSGERVVRTTLSCELFRPICPFGVSTR